MKRCPIASNCSQYCWIDWIFAMLCFKRLFHIWVWSFARLVRPYTSQGSCPSYDTTWEEAVRGCTKKGYNIFFGINIINHKGNWLGTFLDKFWMTKEKFTYEVFDHSNLKRVWYLILLFKSSKKKRKKQSLGHKDWDI